MSSSGSRGSSCSTMYHSTPAARAASMISGNGRVPSPAGASCGSGPGRGPSCGAGGRGRRWRGSRPPDRGRRRPPSRHPARSRPRAAARRAGRPRPSCHRAARTRTHGCGSRAGSPAPRRSGRTRRARPRSAARRRRSAGRPSGIQGTITRGHPTGQSIRDRVRVIAQAFDALVRGDGPQPRLVEQPRELAGGGLRASRRARPPDSRPRRPRAGFPRGRPPSPRTV